ncbi:MAG: signal peptidase I, partial [Myxococcota bacterium]
MLDDDTEDIEPEGFVGWLWDAVKTWGPALLAVLLIRSVFAEPFRIPSGSMVPTLEIGDHILVTKYTYGFRVPLTRIPIGELTLPERGDVAVFVYPGSDEGKMSYWLDLPFPPLATLDYVKRIVALPGDEVEVRDNVLYLNGKAQTKTFIERQDFI